MPRRPKTMFRRKGEYLEEYTLTTIRGWDRTSDPFQRTRRVGYQLKLFHPLKYISEWKIKRNMPRSKKGGRR